MTPATTWLASYPKSGNTWLRVLLDNWFSTSPAPVQINELSPPAWSPNSRARFDSATLLPSDALLPQELELLRAPATQWIAAEITQPAVVKIHNAFSPAFGPAVARAVIYLVRDPRDIAPSLAAHLGLSLDHAIDMINSPAAVLRSSPLRPERQLPQPLSDWSGHLRGWLEHSGLPLHIVRYEDLPGAFAGVLQFLGQSPDPLRLERAIRHSRLDELRRQESATGFKERSAAALFFGQGQPGAWRRALTAAQAARIESAHAPLMRRFGYLAARAASA